MSGGRVIAMLGALVLATVGAGVWLVLGEPAADAPRDDAPAAGAPDATPAPPRDPGARRPGGRRHAKEAGTATVYGVVRRRDGSAPAAGQTVEVLREGTDPWTAEADATGTFRLDGLPDGAPLELRVAAAGCATVRLPGMVLDRGERRDVGTLWLDRAVRVVVSVRTLADVAVEGAEVGAYAAPDAALAEDRTKQAASAAALPVAVATASTDRDGKAVFPELATGKWTFSARKAGFGRDGRTNVVVAGGAAPPEVRIWLATGHRLTGRVLDGARKPIPGALVLAGRSRTVWDPAAAPLRSRSTSDAEGRYALDDLPTGDVAVLVGRKGGVPFQAAVVRVPEVTQYDLTIRDGGRLEGAVTETGTGKPVEGAVVRVTAGSQSARIAEATSGADGRYAVDPVPDGPVHDVAVSKDGWIHDRSDDPAAGRAMQIQAGDVGRRDLRMRRGATVTGAVTGPSGPVAGARVVVMTSHPERGFVQSQPVFTDAEGRFSAAPVERGRSLVRATKEGLVQRGFPENWWPALQQGNLPPQFSVEVPETGEARIEVRLEPGSRVEGRVESPAGPLAGVAVTAVSPAGALPPATSRDDGTFVLEGAVPGTRLSFSPVKEGWIAARNPETTVAADGPTTGVVVRMVRQKVIRGKVTAAGGEALVDAQVTVAARSSQVRRGGLEPMEFDEGNLRSSSERSPPGPPVPVRADGSYEAPIPVAEGPVAVTATALDHAPASSDVVVVAEGRDEYEANVVMDSGYAIRGRVASKGAGVAAADILVGGRGFDGGGTVVATTDAEGGFTVGHVGTGSYTVTARAEGFVPQNAGNVKVPTSGDLAIELEPALEIAGRVTFADGAPAAGAVVSAQRDDARRRGRIVNFGGGTQGITGPDGGFRIRGLGAAAYVLAVQPPWDGSVNMRPKQTDPVVAGTADVKIVVEAGAVISGRVVDSKKAGIAGAQVNANPTKQDAVNQYRSSRTRPDGRFEIAGLGDVPCNVWVQPPQGGDGARLLPASAANVAVGTRDLEIVLEEGLRIEGSIVDANGKPLAEVGIWIQGREDDKGRSPTVNGNNQWAATDAQGGFRFVGLGPGRYRLVLQTWGSARFDGFLLQGGDDVAAGAADLRLVALPGERMSGVVVDEAGQALAGAWVSAGALDGGSSRSARTDRDGRFEMTGLPRGAVRVTGGAPGRPQVTLDGVESNSAVVRIVLPRGMTITGRVLDSGGTLFANQNVYLRQTSGGSGEAWVPTGADGRFTAEALLDGTYDVSVWKQRPDGRGELLKIGTAKAGETVDLKIP